MCTQRLVPCHGWSLSRYYQSGTLSTYKITIQIDNCTCKYGQHGTKNTCFNKENTEEFGKFYSRRVHNGCKKSTSWTLVLNTPSFLSSQEHWEVWTAIKIKKKPLFCLNLRSCWPFFVTSDIRDCVAEYLAGFTVVFSWQLYLKYWVKLIRCLHQSDRQRQASPSIIAAPFFSPPKLPLPGPRPLGD